MNIYAILNSVLDLILPRHERRRRTEVRAMSDITLLPASHELLGTQIETIMDYRDPATEDLIRSLKYDRSKHAAHLCAIILADYLREEVASARTFSTRHIFLIPVPLHEKRKHERGFNQMEIVLDALPGEFRDGTRAYVKAGALVRARATKQQTRLSRSERLSNVADAFRVTDESLFRDAHIILIDDIVTTGATLVNAAKPLQEKGTYVTLLALARA